MSEQRRREAARQASGRDEPSGEEPVLPSEQRRREAARQASGRDEPSGEEPVLPGEQRRREAARQASGRDERVREEPVLPGEQRRREAARQASGRDERVREEPVLPGEQRRRPRESLDRCALRAQLRGDPMLGTAFPAARLLLVEQPGPWGHAGLADSHFDTEVATALQRRADRAGTRVLAIRRPGRTPAGTTRSWAVVECLAGRAFWGTYDADAELLELPLDGSAGRPDDTTTYLTCAHSKHDTCCAIRGRMVAAALAQARPERSWECTHVGGERFAANVLVLPAGHLYGRVLPFAAPEFADATSHGEVVGALLRGQVGLPPTAQAALAFSYEHLAVRRADQLHVVDPGVVAGGRAVVRIAGPHGRVDVTVLVETVRAPGLTCARPGPGSFLSYRPVSAVPAD